jgi:hypothetical protein
MKDLIQDEFRVRLAGEAELDDDRINERFTSVSQLDPVEDHFRVTRLRVLQDFEIGRIVS